MSWLVHRAGGIDMLGLDMSFLNWEIISKFVIKGFWFSIQLTIIATIGGIILGYLGILVVNYYTQDLAGINGAALTGRLIGFAVLVSLIIGLLAGLFPARSAGKIVITQALGRN